MLFATSCENDADVAPNAGEAAVVTFSVGTPEIVSRAYSDGLTATNLQYAVYNENGQILPDLTKTDATISGSTNVKLQLTTGNTYSVIFWAAAPDAPYTVNFENKTMTVNYEGATCNAENRDAFYAYHKFTVNGTQTETIELKRPFAQLNIGTSDYAASASADYTPIKSEVTVKQIYTTLNLENGAVDGKTDVTFACAQIKKNETFPVPGNEYLAMNYLLVDDDKELVEVVFTHSNESKQKTRTVGSVPVQRNYRTNIYGKLLTSEVDVNVVISPDYGEEEYTATVQEQLAIAAQLGGTVALTEDVVLDKPLVVTGAATRANVANVTMEIDLNGHALTYTSDVMENSAMVTVKEGQKLVIKDSKGNGKLSYKYTGAGDPSFGWGTYTVLNYGTVVVENATIEMDCELNPEANSGNVVHMYCALFQYSGKTTINGGTITAPTYRSVRLWKGQMNINGGSFEGQVWVQAADGTAELNIAGGNFAPRGVDGSSVFVTNDTYDAKLKVTGGTFATKIGCSDFTKAGVKGSVSGGTFGVPVNENLVAEGYSAAKNGDKYCVVEGDVDVIANDAAELAEALNADNVTISLAKDINMNVETTGFTVAKTATLNLNGHNIIATSTSTESVQLFSVAGTLNVIGNGTISLTSDNFPYNTSYRYTAINIRETGVVTLGEGVNVICEASKDDAYGMCYAVDIYTTGVLNVNGASLHSNYIAVRCFYGASVVNVNSGSIITSSKNNWGIWLQSATGAQVNIAEGIAYTIEDAYGIYIFG